MVGTHSQREVRLEGFGVVEAFLTETFDVLVRAAMPAFALLAVPLVGGLLVEVLNYHDKAKVARRQPSDSWR